MSTSPQIADPLWSVDNRRALPRRRVSDLAYVGYGADNGGILLDLSEGGLNCQVVGAVVEGDAVHVTFTLPGTKLAIEADCRVIWRNATKKGGGLTFLNLSEESRQSIGKWVLAEESEEPWIEETAEVLAGPSGGAQDKSDVQLVPPAEKPAGTGSLALNASPVVYPLAGVLSYQAGPISRTITAAEPARATNSRPSIESNAARSGVQHGFEQIIAEQPSRRPIIFLVIGAVILAILLGAGIDQAGRLQSWIKILEPGSASISQPAAAASVRANSPFQVEAVGVDNQRWILSNDDSAASEAPSAPPRVANQESRPFVAAPVFASTNKTVSGRPTGLQRPSAPRVPGQLADLAEPDVAADREAGIGPIILPSATPNSPAPPPAEVSKPSEFQAPVLVHRVEPQYGPMLRTGGVQGTVQLRAIVGKDGVPKSISRVSGDPRLVTSAEAALRQWRYKPALDGGEAVEVPVLISVEFHIK